MYAVIFEVILNSDAKDEYLKIASNLKKQLVKVEGFISIERFESLVEEGKLLSLSFWKNKEAIGVWKSNMDHLLAQKKGRNKLFKDYKITITKVERTYTKESSDANY